MVYQQNCEQTIYRNNNLFNASSHCIRIIKGSPNVTSAPDIEKTNVQLASSTTEQITESMTCSKSAPNAPEFCKQDNSSATFPADMEGNVEGKEKEHLNQA